MGKSTYPFGLFLLSLGPTYGQNITSKAISKLMILPRENCIYNEIISYTHNVHIRMRLIEIRSIWVTYVSYEDKINHK